MYEGEKKTQSLSQFALVALKILFIFWPTSAFLLQKPLKALKGLRVADLVYGTACCFHQSHRRGVWLLPVIASLEAEAFQTILKPYSGISHVK